MLNPKAVNFLSALLIIGLLTPLSYAAEEPAAGSLRSTRIDFEDARIQGQSIKAGAVYLANRKKNEIDTMLKQRTDYRSEILREFKYNIYEQEK